MECTVPDIPYRIREMPHIRALAYRLQAEGEMKRRQKFSELTMQGYSRREIDRKLIKFDEKWDDYWTDEVIEEYKRVMVEEAERKERRKKKDEEKKDRDVYEQSCAEPR